MFFVTSLFYRKIGPRSHVWSEKEVVDSAAYEFAEVKHKIGCVKSFFKSFL